MTVSTPQNIQVIGRTQHVHVDLASGASGQETGIRFGFPGVTLRTRFTGTYLCINVTKTNAAVSSYFLVLVDIPPNSAQYATIDSSAGTRIEISSSPNSQSIIIAENLTNTEHTVELVHLTETWIGVITVESLSTDGIFSTEPVGLPTERKLLLIGDSVTCGAAMVLPDSTRQTPIGANAFDSYGMRLARLLNAQCHLVSYGGKGLIRDYLGNSDWTGPKLFETSIPEDSVKSQWNHASYIPDAILISLCTNDVNTGIPNEMVFVDAYVSFLKRIRQVYANAQVFITEGAIVNDGRNEKFGGAPVKSIICGYLERVIELVDDAKIKAISSNHYPGTPADVHPIDTEHESMAQDFVSIFKDNLLW
ncbi:hypothetical protein HK100_005243 [Physocladia obscura]|uniref:Carbohydrate esterase 2 N-terminal domain-containing protein n=1 Tax=Physocladia obscura TaxID=109957 RepID=A0AAD5XIW6_9FUNG|nr:hypothetical protein HK100_005243 [Physocladia obscura]